jgi:hypothetical protein
MKPGAPEFFMPGFPADRVAAEIDRIAADDLSRLVYTVGFDHDGQVLQVTVGQSAPQSQGAVYALVYRPAITLVYELGGGKGPGGNPWHIPGRNVRDVTPFSTKPVNPSGDR